MKEVEVECAKLLEALRTNREKHAQDYRDAMAGYFETAKEKLAEALDKIEAGTVISPYLDLTPPDSHKDDYNRAIEMLEWHTSSHIRITTEDFARFVQDDWDWKQRWTTSNVAYVSKVRG